MLDLDLFVGQIVSPTAISNGLAEAQSVQQVLAAIVAALVFTLLAVVSFYLKERKAWSEEKLAQVKEHNAEKQDILDRWSGAKLEWEQERGRHVAGISEAKDRAASEKEALMREMLDLVLRVERALDTLAQHRQGDL